MVEAGVEAGLADGFQYAQDSRAVHIGGIFRFVEGDAHVTLGGEIVDFLRAADGDDPVQAAGVLTASDSSKFCQTPGSGLCRAASPRPRARLEDMGNPYQHAPEVSIGSALVRPI